MFALGQQLYRLTDRDRQTTPIENFFRRTTLSIAGGQAANSVNLSWAADRLLYVRSINVRYEAEAGTQWIFGATNLFGAGSELISLKTNNIVGAAVGAMVSEYIDLDLVLPLGSTLNFAAQRVVSAGAGTVRFDIAAYLIPPGSFTRGL
jgi:hypothetical protein